MAMTACRECGEQVSKSARTCPYCGISSPGFSALQFVTSLIVVLLIGAGIAGAIGNQNDHPSAANATTRGAHGGRQIAESACGVSMAQYLALKTDMTYTTVVSILGCYGEETSSSEIAGFKSVLYTWRGNGFAANMNAIFQNGRLASKAQFGLK